MGKGETRKRDWPCFRAHWAGRCGRKVGGRWEGSSEPGLAHPSRLLQIVTTAPAIGGDFPENGEHGVSDSVSQSWDVIWCQPFCGHWGQHPYLTSPWEGVSTIMACLPRPLPTGGAQFLSSPATPSCYSLQFSSPHPGQLPLCLPAATCSEALLHKAFPTPHCRHLLSTLSAPIVSV